jgi:hypothetical protein
MHTPTIICTFWSLMAGLVTLAQPVFQVDTLRNGDTHNHTYLNIEVPTGEVQLQSSGQCGLSIAHLKASDPQIRQRISQQADDYGNYLHTIAIEMPEGSPTASNNQVLGRTQANLRVSDHLANLDTYTAQQAYHAAYHLDPNIPTDLFLTLGLGQSQLDFSGLSLNNVTVSSAFSDVLISYQLPNQVEMKKLDIHTANANIELLNLEQARAQLVTVQNDMGETRLTLGAHPAALPHAKIYLKSGVGSCTLVVHPDHPVKLILKNGLLASEDIPEPAFKQLQKGTYVNQAYLRQGKAASQCTSVICSLDFGNLEVVESEEAAE